MQPSAWVTRRPEPLASSRAACLLTMHHPEHLVRGDFLISPKCPTKHFHHGDGCVTVGSYDLVKRVKERIFTMDRNYFHDKAARERQAEISRELATRRLLKGPGNVGPAPVSPRRLLLVGAPLLITLSILILIQIL